MARHSKVVTIDVPGRDFGKVFVVTEMPTMDAAEWFGRACFQISKNGMSVPWDAMANARESDAPFAILGTLAAFIGQALLSLEWPEASVLMAQLYTHMAVKPDASKDETRPIDVNADVEEVWTIFVLKREMLELHLGFSVREELAKLIGSLAEKQQVAVLLAEVAQNNPNAAA